MDFDDFIGDAVWAVAACERLGIPQERLLREARVDPALLEPPALEIPWPDLKRLLETAERLTEDPAFGLHTDFSVLPPRWGMMGQYLLSQRTAREGIRVGTQMSAAMDTVMKMTLEESGGETFFQFRWLAEDAAVRHLVDINLRMTMICTGHYVAREWHPVHLRLRERPVPAQEYERVFRCPVRMGGEFDEMVVEADLLDVPRLTYDPVMVNVLRPYFQNILEAAAKRRRTALWITNAVEVGLQQGEVPTFTAITRRLRTDARTLRARLTQEGTSYRELLEDAKSRHACLLLRNPETKLDSVAGQLGFSAAPPFVRAFRRWLGVTPAEWRRAQKDPTSRSPG